MLNINSNNNGVSREEKQNMIQNINFYNFANGFQGAYKDQFSYDGLKVLFEYFEELEENTGDQIEFDPIAICCEWTEYDNLLDYEVDYCEQVESIEEIEEHTTVLKINDESFIILQY